LIRGPIKTINVEMRGGNDVVVIDAGRHAARVTADGGAGNDEMAATTKGQCVMTGGFHGGPGQDIAKADKGPRRPVGPCSCDYAGNAASKASFMRNGQIESVS
jgi:hypothetical protein